MRQRWICPPTLLLAVCLLGPPARSAAGDETLRLADVFELEWASDPRISPDGERVVYVRNRMDVMSDRRRSSLWIVESDGGGHRALWSGDGDASSPRWSPDAGRLLFVVGRGGSAQIHLRWMDTGQTAPLTNLTEPPSGLSWSPDGRWISFSMFVPRRREPLAEMPPAPEGAEWAEPPVVIEELLYRADGAGYLEEGYRHLFVLPTEGGTPRQVTSGDFQHTGTALWAADGRSLIFSANRHEDWRHDPLNSELYQVSLEDRSIRALTDRVGPDRSPALSPDGRRIAWLGFDDRQQGYQVTRLEVMDRNGGNRRTLTADFDRGVQAPAWGADGEGIFFRYDDRGNSKVAYAPLDGMVRTLAGDLGGVSLGRPYAGGSFTVADDGRFAYTYGRPSHPADVAVAGPGAGRPRPLTRLNEDLLGQRELGQMEEIHWLSSFDGRKIQGWVVKPPGFDASRTYPLILEIHGGPFANYGDRFSMEGQLYAADGYVVLFPNPRGSTSYGEEFGNLIHHAYPGHDYDDLMSGVDEVLSRGFIDPENLFVTGGSGGGVLSSWIIGKTDRFRAAVVAKPVINWYSFALTADMYNFFHRYWFPGFPWDHAEHYLARSPISLVGNVSTPTMLLTGEADHRTPISESEQYYQALKLRKIEAALVRIPGASHGIARRPSNLIAKVAHVLAWFERYRR